MLLCCFNISFFFFLTCNEYEYLYAAKDQHMEATKNVKRIKLSTISPIWHNPSSKSNVGLNEHTEENGSCLYEHELSDNSGTLCDSIDQCWVGNSSLFHSEAVNQVSAKLQSATTERDVLLTVDAGASNMDSQHNHLSKVSFNNLSAKLQVCHLTKMFQVASENEWKFMSTMLSGDSSCF